MRTRIKVCGVTQPEHAQAAAELGAWAVGFVFVPSSRRRMVPEQALEAAEGLPAGVLRVGVFMDQPLDEVLEWTEEARLDLIQLHGNETADYCERVGLHRLIKSFTLGTDADVAAAMDHGAEYFLIDRPRSGADALGDPPDRVLSARLCASHEKTLLAGALTPENVADAVRRVRPWGLDVSGGVEYAPGMKDVERMEAFFAAVAAAEAATGEAV